VKDSAPTFGYAYPETQKWNFATTAAYQTALRQSVVNLYGSNVFRNFVENVAARTPAAVAAAAPAPALASAPAGDAGVEATTKSLAAVALEEVQKPIAAVAAVAKKVVSPKEAPKEAPKAAVDNGMSFSLNLLTSQPTLEPPNLITS